MREVADGVHQISRGVNAFIVDGDDGVVPIDTGLPRQHGRIEAGLASIGRSLQDVRAIVITHGHVDHVGGAAAIVAGSTAEVYAPSKDTAAIEGREPNPPPPFMDRLAFLIPLYRFAPSGDPVDVDHRVDDAEVSLPSGVRAIPTPGHTPGHTSYLLDRSGGVLFVGDAAVASKGRIRRGWMNRATPQFDASLASLADLEFEVACFGHAAPITKNAAAAFRGFVGSL